MFNFTEYDKISANENLIIYLGELLLIICVRRKYQCYLINNRMEIGREELKYQLIILLQKI